jgi:hypothetical protein
MNEIMNTLREYTPSDYLSSPVSIETMQNYNIDFIFPQEVNELTHGKQYLFLNHRIIFFYTTEDTDKLFSYIDRLLYLLKDSKVQPVDAVILLSSAKKTYPHNRIFGQSNVNSGYWSAGKIVVYRKEEWFKVFIHECFHHFHYENVLFDEKLSKRILKIFKVDSEVNLYESYCEVWARTLNCCMKSVCNKVPLETLLYHEKRYAVRHMVNVLHHMNLTYHKIQYPCNYRENTNVLSYVVITAILMFQDFIPTHMSSMPSFRLIDSEPYIHFIETHYENHNFLNYVNHIKPRVTTCMSLYTL